MSWYRQAIEKEAPDAPGAFSHLALYRVVSVNWAGAALEIIEAPRHLPGLIEKLRQRDMNPCVVTSEDLPHALYVDERGKLTALKPGQHPTPGDLPVLPATSSLARWWNANRGKIHQSLQVIERAGGAYWLRVMYSVDAISYVRVYMMFGDYRWNMTQEDLSNPCSLEAFLHAVPAIESAVKTMAPKSEQLIRDLPDFVVHDYFRKLRAASIIPPSVAEHHDPLSFDMIASILRRMGAVHT